MLFLLDANVLIDAGRDYYPPERVPEFWDWLLHQGNAGRVKMPVDMYEEVEAGRDAVAAWLRTDAVITALRLQEEADGALVARAVADGYARDLTQVELVKVGRDPFLLAHALADIAQRCVVTTENSRPSLQRANRRLPDVCATLGVSYCHTFEMLRRLNFTTQWRNAP